MGDGVDVGRDCYLRGVAMDNYPTRHHTFNDDYVCVLHTTSEKSYSSKRAPRVFFVFGPIRFSLHHHHHRRRGRSCCCCCCYCFVLLRPTVPTMTPRGCPMEISDLTRAKTKNKQHIILIFTNTNHIFSESQWDVFYSDVLL